MASYVIDHKKLKRERERVDAAYYADNSWNWPFGERREIDMIQRAKGME